MEKLFFNEHPESIIWFLCEVTDVKTALVGGVPARCRGVGTTWFLRRLWTQTILCAVPQIQGIYSQHLWDNAFSWHVMSRAWGCVLCHSEMLCYHQSTPKRFRPSFILLDSSYPLALLMRLEQSPLPEGAARCSSSTAGVLELEGKGPQHVVPSWHMWWSAAIWHWDLTVLSEPEKRIHQVVWVSPLAPKAP